MTKLKGLMIVLFLRQRNMQVLIRHIGQKSIFRIMYLQMVRLKRVWSESLQKN